MHRTVAAVLAAVLALGLAGCGDSSEPLTRAEVVRRIEVACRNAQTASQKASRTARGQEAFFGAVLVGQRQLARDVEGIEASDELADEVDAFQSAVSERADEVAKVVDAARAEQQRVAEAATARVTAATRQIQTALRRLGVRGCE